MKLTLANEKATKLALALLVGYGTMLLPPEAFASGGTGEAISDLLCGVAGWFTHGVGAGIATLAIIVIGIGALMGKVSWGMAIIVALGIAVVFGAKSLVADIVSMTGNGSSACTS